MEGPKSSRGSRWRMAGGVVVAVLALFGLAESFLRFFPPRDLQPYLGEASALTGVYQPDPAFGVAYRSFDDFAAENAKALKPWLPLDAPAERRPIWAMFGSSFVHMRGMLADTARKSVADRAVFNLGKNEPLPLRMAQIRLLLERGFRPERIFFQIMPLDFAGLAEHSLDHCYVTDQGALTYRPKLPAGPAGDAILHSRLALTAWCRTGWHRGNADTARRRFMHAVDAGVLRDARRLFGELARVAARHETPVTVILVPTHEQIWRKAPCGFQDTMTPLLRELGFDVCDPRVAFLEHTDRPGLFIPDKHFSPEGNRLLLAELRGHLDQVARGVARPEQGAKGVRALPTSARPSKTQSAPPGNDEEGRR